MSNIFFHKSFYNTIQKNPHIQNLGFAGTFPSINRDYKLYFFVVTVTKTAANIST